MELGGGVEAFPRSAAKFYPGAFIKSGFGGARKPSPKLHGQVFERYQGRKIRLARTGVFIPAEFVQGTSRAAFEGVVSIRLAALVAGMLTRIAGAPDRVLPTTPNAKRLGKALGFSSCDFVFSALTTRTP